MARRATRKTCLIGITLCVVSFGCGHKPIETTFMLAQETNASLVKIHVQDESQKRPTPKNLKTAMESMDQIRELYNATSFPSLPGFPLDIDEVASFAQVMTNLTGQFEHDIRWLEKLDASSLSSDQFESKRIEQKRLQMLANLNEYSKKQLSDLVDQGAHQITSNINSHIELIQFAAEIDLKDRDKVVNVLVDKEQLALREQAIDHAEKLISVGKAYEKKLNRDLATRTLSQKLMQVVNKFRKKVAGAVDAIELPTEIKQPELSKIAKETLILKKYGLPKAEKVIVTTKKRSKSRESVHFESGRLIRNHLCWQEFSVATIEKDSNGGLSIWHNTFAYFTKGGATTPLNNWILSERFRSSPISPSKLK